MCEVSMKNYEFIIVATLLMKIKFNYNYFSNNRL